MADVTKTSKQLKLVANFADGDDRTIAIDDPKTDLTKDDINDADFVKSAAEVLIGDKAAAGFTNWKSAKIVENSTVYLDLADLS